jgi:lycopene cyclase domain-containing protein
VESFAYAAMLAFVLLVTLPLELVLGVRVYRQPRRLARTLLPVVAVFVLWDLYGISREHWGFDPAQLLGVELPGGLPVEELLFFLAVPIASIMALEAVRTVQSRRGWRLGDEGE